MHNTLVALLGNYGDHWQHLPVTARNDNGDVIAFFDHRMPIHDRVCATARLACQHGITCIQRVVMAPVPVDCSAGVHDWTAVTRGAATVAVQCGRCGYREQLDPPLPIVEMTQVSVAS